MTLPDNNNEQTVELAWKSWADAEIIISDEDKKEEE